jgi:hypothetical protein
VRILEKEPSDALKLLGCRRRPLMRRKKENNSKSRSIK